MAYLKKVFLSRPRLKLPGEALEVWRRRKSHNSRQTRYPKDSESDSVFVGASKIRPAMVGPKQPPIG